MIMFKPPRNRFTTQHNVGRCGKVIDEEEEDWEEEDWEEEDWEDEET